jgi:membrane protease subunit HflK
MTMRHPSNIPQGQLARLGAVAAAAMALLRGATVRVFGGGARRSAGSAPMADILILNNGRKDGPPDLDELWRDFNGKLTNLFGNKNGRQRPGNNGGGDGGNSGGPPFQPDMKSAGIGVGLIAGVIALVWAGSGVYIVQEGSQAVVTQFGRYVYTTDAGIQYRFPYPFQAHETVPVTQLRSVDVGRSTVAQATGLRDSSMLTQDENIIDIRFTVQYRLKDARQYLFENRNPDDAVVLASESAVREIVGASRVDSVLYEQREAVASDLARVIQAQLDRLNAGIVIASVNVQNVQVPDQVQAAFNDAVKASADRDRFRNEGEAYASDVIPKAQGAAARLREEAEGYRARIVSQAEGDSQRFRSVLTEYQKAPTVTRDRLYLETMQQVYSNVTKVMVDSRSGSNLLYLPLDRLIQQTGTPSTVGPATAVPTPESPSAVSIDARARDTGRGRERDSR